MSDTCQTLKVKADNEDGYAIINESDFDAAVHEHFDADETQAEDAPKRRGRPPKARDVAP